MYRFFQGYEVLYQKAVAFSVFVEVILEIKTKIGVIT